MIRFGKDDTIAPGPGAYTAPQSCKVREPKHAGATYRSGVTRDFEQHVVGIKNPGIGEYDLTGFNAIGGSTFEGGGAPSNFTICYKDMNPTIRKVEVKKSPRIHSEQINTPSNIGPGTYTQDPGQMAAKAKYRPPKVPKKDTCWAS